MTMKRITTRQELEAALARRSELSSKAVAEKRDWTAEEAAEISAINHELDRYERLSAGNAGGGGTGDPLLMASQRQSQQTVSVGQRSPLAFRDMATGRLVHARGPGEPVAAAEDMRIPFADYVGAAIGRQDSRERITAAMQGNDFTSGGVMVLPAAMGRQVIDLMRPSSAVINAGARIVAIDNSEMRMVVVDGDPSASWRGEGEDIVNTEGNFSGINVLAKNIGVMTTITRELAEDAPNAQDVVTMQLLAAMGQGLDLTCLRGPAAGAGPTGLRYQVDPAHAIDYTTLSSPGVYTHAVRAMQKIYQTNYQGTPSGLSWIYSPARLGVYEGAVDSTGQPLVAPGRVGQMRQVVSNQVPSNLVDGTKTEEYFGDFSQAIIFIRSAIDLRVSMEAVVVNADNSTTNTWSKNMLAIRATMRADFVLLRRNQFVVLHKVAA